MSAWNLCYRVTVSCRVILCPRAYESAVELLNGARTVPRMTQRRRGGRVFVSTTICSMTAAACIAACAEPDTPGSAQDLYPVEFLDAGLLRLDFGPGSLQTTDDQPWGGVASVLYPAALDTEAGPVEFEIQGLDLSGIEYTGDMGWPPDSTDSGALVQASLVGSHEVSYRVWSSVAELLSPSDSAGPEALSPADFRAYQFRGYLDNVGAYGVHSLRLERLGSPESRGPYNTVDLRVRYENGIVRAWTRLYASLEWDEGGRGRGGACPWNVAINNAIPGTVDSVWTGECRAERPGETGRPVGAWVPFAGGGWATSEDPRSVQIRLSLLNWQNARGPYSVTWRNVIVRGLPDSQVSSSTGEGVLRAFGAGGSEIEPRGEWGEFSYRATEQGVGVRPGAILRYRAPGFELSSEGTSWVVISANDVRFAGQARANGSSGYRFEFRGAVAAGSAPDSLSLEVWAPESLVRPYYTVFGSLHQGSVEVKTASRD